MPIGYPMAKRNQVTVLIVDDDISQRRLQERLLRKTAGYAWAGSFENGVEALPYFSQLCPDIVLLDLYLPIASGFACLRQIKSQLPDCQVIIVTESSDPGNQAAARQCNAAGYLLKPFTAPQLIEAMDLVLAVGQDGVSGARTASDAPDSNTPSILNSLCRACQPDEREGVHAAVARAAQYKVKALAALCKICERQLDRFFAQRLKTTPWAWMRGCKLLESKRLRMEGFSGKEIARQLGYRHVSNYYAWSMANSQNQYRGW